MDTSTVLKVSSGTSHAANERPPIVAPLPTTKLSLTAKPKLICHPVTVPLAGPLSKITGPKSGAGVFLEGIERRAAIAAWLRAAWLTALVEWSEVACPNPKLLAVRRARIHTRYQHDRGRQ